MDYIDGALGFKATLDIDDFSVSAQAMEKHIKRVSNSAQDEIADMDNTLLRFAQRGAAYIATYLIGNGMVGLVQSIVQTRGQFQQLEIAFETMLGSGTKAQALMNQLVDTAARTPFDLMGVAGGAKQLMAYGLAADKVNDTLVRLGNIASGLSIPLNDIVYLYGTTMVQGRLYAQDVRQFTGRGIPLVRELADMYGVTSDKINEMVTDGKIGFADVEKVLNKLTGAGGQFYNLMAKQSASLTGMISNLSDAWDSMLNEIGKRNQDLFAGAIGMASDLVEHYDDIIRILKAVAVGYGTVKASIVANTLVTKGYTGVALIDNTVRAAKIALLKADAALTGQTKAQTDLMAASTRQSTAASVADTTAKVAQSAATSGLTSVTRKAAMAVKLLWGAMKANPMGWILSIVGLVTSAITLFTGKTKEARTAQGEFQDATNKQTDELRAMMAVLENTTNGTNSHKKALDKINELCKEYNLTLLDENSTLEQQKKKYEELTKAIQDTTAEKIKAKYTEQAAQDRSERDTEALDDLKKSTGKFKNYYVPENGGQGYWYGVKEIQGASDALFEMIEADAKSAAEKLKNISGEEYNAAYREALSGITKAFQAATGAADKDMDSYKLVLEKYFSDIVDSAKQETAKLRNELSQIEKYGRDATGTAVVETNDADETDKLNTEAGISARIKELKDERANVEINSKAYKSLTQEIENLYAKLPSNNAGGENTHDALLKKQLEAEEAAEEARISMMKDGYEKRQAILELEHKRALERIDKDEKELVAARRKAGYDGLSDSEKQGFSDRRAAEEQSYNVDELQLRNEMLGVKGAMDLFSESISEAVDNAETLAEKIKVVADARKKLENGDYDLNADERTQAAFEIEKSDAELHKQLRDKLITDYQTYNEKLLSIQNNYQALLTEAEKEGNKERIGLVKRGMEDAVSALNAELLMGTESWKRLFSDLDLLTVEQIDQLVTEIQEKMNTADLNLNPSDLKAVLDQLDAAKKKILDTNPFKALGSAMQAVFKNSQNGAKKSSEQIKKDWNNLAKATSGTFDFIDNAIDSCDVLKDTLGDTGQAVLDNINGIAMAGIAMAAAIKAAEKGSVILTAISAALQVVQTIFSAVNPDKQSEDRVKALEDHVKGLKKVYDQLENAKKRTFWIFTPEEQASYELRLKMVRESIEAHKQEIDQILRSGDVSISTLQRLIKERKDLMKNKGDLKIIEAEMRYGDMTGILEAQIDTLEKEKEDLLEAIEEERGQKKTDKGKIEDWEDEITSIENKMEDLRYEMQETFAGTDVKSAIDDFGDALWDAIVTGENAMDAFGEKVQDVLKNAVKESLKRQFLAKGVNDAIAYLGDAMQDSLLTDDERARFEAMANMAGETYKKAIEGLGDWIMDVEGKNADPLAGAISSLSEETGNIVAGRMNAVVINQTMQMELLRNQLVYQAQIAANTGITASEIQQIKADVRRIANQENNLLAQGIS